MKNPFAFLPEIVSLFRKPYSYTKLSSLNETRSKSQSSLRRFLVLSIIACCLYIVIYYTVASSSICTWSTILSFNNSLPKSGPSSSSLQPLVPHSIRNIFIHPSRSIAFAQLFQFESPCISSRLKVTHRLTHSDQSNVRGRGEKIVIETTLSRNKIIQQEEWNENKEYLLRCTADLLYISGDSTDPSDDDDVKEEIMSCKLPNLDPFHPSIIGLIEEPDKLECANETWPDAFLATFSTLRQVKPFPGNATYNCCFKPFKRSTDSDKQIQYSDICHRIPPWQEVKVDEEFVHVFCHDSTSYGNTSSPVFQDMFAFVPLKPSVESRISSQDSKQSEWKSSPPSPPVGRQDKLNIVILGLDGQSRMNFIRQMPLSHSYLISNLSAISLQGYTKVADNTFPNTVPLLTGLSIEELQKTCWPTTDSYFDDCPFIWNNFSAHGYRTSFAEDSVWMGIFNYVKKGFRHPPTDYYLNPFSKYINDELGHESLGNSELCYGPRQSFQVLLDYIRNTAAVFNGNKPYFQFVWSAGLFHDYLNVPKLGDSLLFNMLHFLHSQNYLNQTLFILMSDHGPRWGDIRETFQGKIEERMPFVYLAFPPWFHSKYPHLIKNLNLNSNRLTTAFDLHLLLRDMLYLPKYLSNFITRSSKTSEKEQNKLNPRAYSLFQIIPPSRTCEDAGIANHWCVCDAMVELALNTTFLESAASSVVNYVNEILNPVSNICAKLQLNRIIQAVHLTQYKNEEPGSSNSSASSSPLTIPERITIQINFETHPGDALFEATLTGFWSKANVTTVLKENNSDTSRNSDEWDYANWEISQTVSRINSYASQATCISDFKLEKYCFCQTNSSSHY